MFKSGDKYFVANVYNYPSGLTLRVHSFDSHRVWDKDHFIHIVVPKQTV